MKYTSSNSGAPGYAIISAVLLVGFLLVLTAGSFHLVLQELYDGRGKQNYLKAYAAAEAGLEQALLKIKEEGYGYYEERDFGTDILGDNIKISQVSYEFLGRSQNYTGNLAGFGVDIIPLFWIDTAGVVHNLENTLSLSADDSIAWNIVGVDIGVGGNGSFESLTKQVDKKTLEDSGGFTLQNDTLDAFLAVDEEKYIFIVNTSSSPLSYTINSSGDNLFTLPRHDIISSGRVGNYVQNIRTELDNTEFLGLLRYSIYAGD